MEKGDLVEIKVRVSSPVETIAFAKKLGSGLKSGVLLTLEGSLAAGKTTFIKGLALGLGISDIIDSPTFAMVKEYEGKLPLFHMDVYRLAGDSDIWFILEYFDRKGVCVIEWASIIAEDLPKERIEIKIERLEGDCREITVMDKVGVLGNVNFSD